MFIITKIIKIAHDVNRNFNFSFINQDLAKSTQLIISRELSTEDEWKEAYIKIQHKIYLHSASLTIFAHFL